MFTKWTNSMIGSGFMKGSIKEESYAAHILLVISFILLLTSCSSFNWIEQPNDPISNSYEDYQECIDINSKDESKCDYLIPHRTMQPNLTEHKNKLNYH